MIRSTTTLENIREKIEGGDRLSFDDGLFLYQPEVSLHEIGQLANWVRERKNGNTAYYNINTHLNPTNVCVYRCSFCAFRSDLRDSTGYVMSDEQILGRGREAVDNGCTEMHIVGGLHHQNREIYPGELYQSRHRARIRLLPGAGESAQPLDITALRRKWGASQATAGAGCRERAPSPLLGLPVRAMVTGALEGARGARPRIASAAFSASMIVGALRLPLVIVGKTAEPTTRKASIPRTRHSGSSTAMGSSSAPILQVQEGW